MKAFKSIEDIKSRGEFFPEGKIVPKRVLSVEPKNLAHTVKFNHDSWVIPTPKGYLVYSEYDINDNDGWFHDDEHGNKVKQRSVDVGKSNNINCKGSPYTPNGITWFYCNSLASNKNEEALNAVNDFYVNAHKSTQDQFDDIKKHSIWS